MSNRFNFTSSMLAPGVSYMLAYTRMVNGWSVERATTEPPRVKCQPRIKRTEAPLYIWDRPEWNATARKPIRRKTHARRCAEDTSPPHIKKLREAYCNEFIKTGNLNPELAAKLKAYANEYQSAKNNLAGVPRQPQAQGGSEPRSHDGDDGDRNDHQIAGA